VETVQRPEKPMISLVIPVFNEAANIRRLYPKLTAFLSGHGWGYELVYVRDGGTDESEAEIRALAAKDNQVRFVIFSRNFGKEAATSAGIKRARGDAIVLYDADGQFPLELIERFVERWQAGADVVIGVRKTNRDEGWVKRYGSKLFNWMLKPLTDGQSVPGETDFRLIDRKVADKFNELTERTRITRGLIDWLGFERVLIPFHANAREDGAAGYTFHKLVRLARHSFVSQSTKPLQFTGVLGAIVTAISFLVGFFVLIEKYLLDDPLHLAITGTAALAVFLSFLVGIVLVCQGLLALYIESIHAEAQNRPLYVVRDES
jgi:polyisoprenyl-phosphate glycosyltransferase